MPTPAQRQPSVPPTPEPLADLARLVDEIRLALDDVDVTIAEVDHEARRARFAAGARFVRHAVDLFGDDVEDAVTHGQPAPREPGNS